MNLHIVDTEYNSARPAFSCLRSDPTAEVPLENWVQIVVSSFFLLLIFAAPAWADNHKNMPERFIKVKHEGVDEFVSFSKSFQMDVPSHLQPQQPLTQRQALLQMLEMSPLYQYKDEINKLLAEMGLFAFLQQRGFQISDDLFELLAREETAAPALRFGILSFKQYSKDFLTPTGYISENGFLVQLDF